MKRKVMITLNMTTSLRNDDLESWIKANVQKKKYIKEKRSLPPVAHLPRPLDATRLGRHSVGVDSIAPVQTKRNPLHE